MDIDDGRRLDLEVDDRLSEVLQSVRVEGRRPALNHTRVFSIRPEERANYTDLLVSQWRHLEWRHAGFGALQAYLVDDDGLGHDELRVHAWHPDLVRQGIVESGLCHDHRFDMRSIVLAGSISQSEVLVRPSQAGHWTTSEVIHAREAMSIGGSYHADPVPTGCRYDRIVRSLSVDAGSGYDFPKLVFHETRVSEPTVTLVRKLDQSAVRARILHPHDVPIVPAFEDPLPPARYAGALADVLAVLLADRRACRVR
jgi:hypothetical protein